MESFREAASKETCFSLCLRKGKPFIQLFWLLGFTVVAEKNIFFVELPSKNPPEKNSEKNPNKKSNFLKMCYFVYVSCKESNLQYTQKLTCNSICNILLLLWFLRYDQLKWERQITLIWKKVFVFGRQCVKIYSVIPFSENSCHIETS